MYPLRIPGVLLTVLFVATCAGTAFADLMIIAGSDSAALLAQDTRFDPRLQLQSSLYFGFGARFLRGLELAGGIGTTRATATSAAVGYSYPGWTGRTAWVRIGYLGPRISPIGFRLTAFGVLAGYDSTFLLSFFPILEFATTAHFPLTGNSYGTIGFPIGWEIRRDLGIRVGNTAVLPGAVYVGISAAVHLSVSPVTRGRTATAPSR